MAFCITFGTHDFTNRLHEYEGVTAQCQNCGNWAAYCETRWPWFTICFLPVIPLALHKYSEVACPICRFSQDLSMRPDVQSQMGHPNQPHSGANMQGSQSIQGQEPGKMMHGSQGAPPQSGPPQGQAPGPGQFNYK